MWSDIEKSKHISREAQGIRNKLDVFDKAKKAVSDAEIMISLAEEEDDESVLGEVDKDLTEAEKEIEEIRLRTLLRGKYDSCDAILTLHAGAGGTEACDWTEMLYRMYICYAEKHGYKITEYDRLDGDGAGLKSVCFKVEGENAYGYLKAEKGIHRLVRISPFDANARRQTSFSSVDVMPDIQDEGDIEIRPEDIRLTPIVRRARAGSTSIKRSPPFV